MPRNVIRGGVLGIAGQGWQMVTALFLYAFLARRFGTALFGSWLVVISVLAWFEVFVQYGVARVATKVISESPEESRTYAVVVYVTQAAMGLAVFALLEITAPLLARLLGHPDLALLLRVSALDVPIFGLMFAASSVVLGEGRFERQGVAWTVYATAKVVLISALVVAGYGVVGALVGNALASAVGFAAMFVATAGSRPTRAQTLDLARWMLAASVPFLTLALLEGLGQSLDLWIVSGMVTDRGLVGLYAAGTVLAEIPVFLFLGLNRVLFPSVAQARATGDDGVATRYATQAVRASVVVTVLGVALMIAAGRQVIALIYGTGYSAAYVPAVLLMAAGMGRAVRATCTEVLMAEDRRREAIMILLVTVVAEAAAVALLLPRFGLPGAAAGAALTALLAAAWAATRLRASVDVSALATPARSLVAGAIVAAGLSWAMPQPSAPKGILLAGTLVLLLVGTAAYFGALWVLREVRADDVSSFARALNIRQREADQQ